MKTECSLLLCSSNHYYEEASFSAHQFSTLGFTKAFRAYAMLGTVQRQVEGFETVPLDRRGTWSAEMKAVLRKLDSRYVMLLMDDFVPIELVDLDEIVRLVLWLEATNGNYLRLIPRPRGTGEEVLPGIREIERGVAYRAAVPFTVWRRELLIDLLVDAETAWHFEIIGSLRTDAHPRFYASDRELVRWVNLVVKGLVDPRAERELRENGIPIPSISRPRMNQRQLLSLQLREMRTRVFNVAPGRVQRRIRSLFQV